MTRLAAIDIGTNSTKTTLADIDAQGHLSVVYEDSDVTRLGEGVDASKRLSDVAMSRTLDAIARFAERAREEGAVDVLATGTSALRDAVNGHDFVQEAMSRAGVEIEIITGDREATLAYAAVRSDSSLDLPTEGALLVFDIGGGSTELILGDAQGVGRHKSLDIGAVRLTERFLPSDPPAVDELAQASRFADDAFATFARPDARPVIAGIGGTAVNIASVLRGLSQPDPDAVHGLTLTRAEVDAALSRFTSVPLAERRQIPGLEPKRADIISAGALILSHLLSYFGSDGFTLSARGLRYGLLAEHAKTLR